MNNATILFIGGGNLTHAIVSGLYKTGYSTSNIYVLDVLTQRCDIFSKEFGIHSTTIASSALFDSIDVIVFAVKPQSIDEVLNKYHPLIKQSLIISVLAGVSISHFEQRLSNQYAIIRALPNTPTAVQQGATGLFGNLNVTLAERQQAEILFQAVGITVWVNQESDLELITGLSGCGPAYFYTFFEALMDKAIALGMSPATARELTIQTALGAAEMLKQTSFSPQELCSQVASKGGATAAALDYLHQNQFAEIIQQAMLQAINRATELGEIYG